MPSDTSDFEGISDTQAELRYPLAIAIIEQRGSMSIRELARRSGVEASQISRIEAGRILRPRRNALERIAAGLYRPVEPLLFLAGHTTDEEFTPWLTSFLNHYDVMAAAFEGVRAAMRRDDYRGAALSATRGMDTQSITSPLQIALGENTTGIIELFADALPALTSDRRKLVAAYIQDQRRLSETDRLENERDHGLDEARHPMLEHFDDLEEA